MLHQIVTDLKSSDEKTTRRMLRRTEALQCRIEQQLSQGTISLGKKIDFDTSLLNRKNQYPLPRLYKPSLEKSQHSSRDRLKIQHLKAQFDQFQRELQHKTHEFHQSLRKKNEELRRRHQEHLQQQRLRRRLEAIQKKQQRLKVRNVLPNQSFSNITDKMKSISASSLEKQRRQQQLQRKKEMQIQQKIREITDKKKQLVQIKQLTTHQEKYEAALEKAKSQRKMRVREEKAQSKILAKQYASNISKSSYYYKVIKQTQKDIQDKQKSAHLKEELRNQVSQYSNKVRKAFSHLRFHRQESPSRKSSSEAQKTPSISFTQLKAIGNKYLKQSLLVIKKKQDREVKLFSTQQKRIKPTTDYLRQRREQRVNSQQKQRNSSFYDKEERQLKRIMQSGLGEQQKIQRLKKLAYSIDAKLLQQDNRAMIKKVRSKMRILEQASSQNLL